MKYPLAIGLTLLLLSAGYALADPTPPSDDTLKKQFSEQYQGMIHLDSVSLRPLNSLGNQSTWSAEGDVSSTQDLYATVGMAADYRLVEKTWTKGKPVKFSAMVTATGTKDSGWTTEFFSMQTAAKNAGVPLDDVNDKTKYLVVNDSNFYARLATIEASYSEQKKTLQGMESQQKALEKEIAELDDQIKRSWGTDANGKLLSRGDVQQAMLEEMYQADRKNDPLTFENHYYKTIYEPALAACQQKPDCDAEPLRKARDVALEEQKRDYSRQHKLRSEKIKEEMAARDEKVRPLYAKQGELRTQLMKLDTSSSELESSYTRWQQDITDLRRRGVIK